MQQSQAHRRLVKSPPELWAEVSSEDALARHLAQFGEIRITRLEPETTVAWEGDRASGTVRLEPSGWGTKVVLTATLAHEGADEAPAAAATRPAARPEADPGPVASPTSAPTAPHAASAIPPAPQEPARGFFDRLFRRRPQAAVAQAPGAAPADPGPPALGPEPPPPAPDPAPTARAPVAAAAPQREAELGSERTGAILADVLDGLGAAHHRPFSRD